MKFFIIIILLFFRTQSFSHEKTYVYCVNAFGKWKWLENEQGQIEQVSGTLHKWHTNLTSNKIRIRDVYFHYFIPINAEQKISELSQKCIKKFGKEFFTPQPANNKFNKWKIFAIDHENFISGIFDSSQAPFYYYPSVFDNRSIVQYNIIPYVFNQLSFFTLKKNIIFFEPKTFERKALSEFKCKLNC
ncbi:hypothetical protein [Fluviispira multicolorata]|uniref:Uncharacterized protein n=1 Tax=Fluviispira multicolorata TaxID=2654512 RepID=A0A833JBJ6_9BACT|nr:hypothetical protein [Fluviispira multicolorata]KAB8029676.1 hypothetical protein GCL57_09010 [Fluviispira multicolorata]